MGERIDSVARGKLTLKRKEAEAVPGTATRLPKPSSKAAHRMRAKLQGSGEALIGAELAGEFGVDDVRLDRNARAGAARVEKGSEIVHPPVDLELLAIIGERAVES